MVVSFPVRRSFHQDGHQWFYFPFFSFIEGKKTSEVENCVSNFSLICYSGALAREARQRSTMVRKWSNLPIRENLVITWPYTDRPSIRPSVRTTGIPMENNFIKRYGNPNAIRDEVISAGNRIATCVLWSRDN